MGQAESNESAAVKRQAEGFSNPMYRMLDLGGGGLFMELGKRAMLTNNTMELDEAIRSKIKPYLYNGGAGKWIHCAHLACLRNRDRPKSKQFPEILALGDAAFDFQFEDSDLLAEMIGEDTRETYPDRYTEHCWNVENRGAVGETTFHVCFLMGTPTHMFVAKRILQWYPKLLHDIYLSEEYYGENVLHMGCVAEDASLVKWLLDIGSDFHRRCYGNFFCCDDQKAHRGDSIDHEPVDVPLKTNYLGYVSWGEYPMNFAAVLNQEEIFRLILAKGGNFDLQDTNGCTVTHIMVVYDNIKMFDMATECGAAINIENKQGLTTLTTAAFLARMDMFFHIASIEREIYWQLGNVTCSAYPLKYLDTIHSETGELNTISALNLIVFGPKLEHLDLIEYVIVDLLKVKWESFVKREFFKQFFAFTIFFFVGCVCFIARPGIPEGSCPSSGFNSSSENSTSWLSFNSSLEGEVGGNCTEEEMEIDTSFEGCHLLAADSTTDKVRLGCEASLVVMALLYLLQAVRQLNFLGRKIFLENMALCPSRVCFLFSCILLQLCVPVRLACLYSLEDPMAQLIMLCNGLYFLFFCRGFKLVGPMVIMIYRMLAQDLMRFGIIYTMFIMGFAQAYYIIFQSYEVMIFFTGDFDHVGLCRQGDGDELDEENPLGTPVESFVRVRKKSKSKQE